MPKGQDRETECHGRERDRVKPPGHCIGMGHSEWEPTNPYIIASTNKMIPAIQHLLSSAARETRPTELECDALIDAFEERLREFDRHALAAVRDVTGDQANPRLRRRPPTWSFDRMEIPVLSLPYDLADVFTETFLGGNQLAVFAETNAPLNSDLMQAIALEMNLSETVFLLPAQHPAVDARVRLYSTMTEIDFAGHPLLGTAAILACQRADDEVALRIETNVGIVPVTVRRHGGERFTGWMDQPLPQVETVPREQAARLLDVLGLKTSVLPITRYDAGIPHVYVVADDPETVRGIVPNFPALGEAAVSSRINVLALTGPNTAVTRMFSPYGRVPEDPACGSAAGPLAAHLVRHGHLASGAQITLSQGEAVGRPSTLLAVAVVESDRPTSIQVGGGVCLVGDGKLRLPERN
ncbi:PhzF family phenazine biosynthesis protein [Streptomyces sp. DG2A-72]|uniref:PhzF family phenazine biosynthesis protein n=1 Tax=Streptomyces sp. DG2A-72 TaxID=3051386 RepID=UPI00265C6EE2|nr:PhzF family phenazine biosynthesis protein [Streptomyces sp. DG2A-72]MDO0938986.1 PhzF family phenazine biosynthesis protein [Streptomyces sp. DG2A-72]